MSEFLLSHFSKILVFGCDQEASQYFRTLFKTSGIDSTHRELFKKSKIIEIGSRRKKLQPPKVDDFSEKSMVDRKYSYVQIQLNFNLFAASIVVSVALEI